MKFQFYTCDVFTDKRFGGNPLAVVLDASALSTDQMQLIAREFNFSETTFVLPPEQGYTNRVRIFTRTRELPFAGHPNIGTAFTLATIGRLGDIKNATNVVFEEPAGLVPISLRHDQDKPFWCELKAPEPLSLGNTIAPERVANALSLTPDDIVCDIHKPQVASVGLAFNIIQLKDRASLERVKVNAEAISQLVAEGYSPGLFTYVRSDDEFDIRARTLGETFEDPATGSANCALAGLLAHYDQQDNGLFSWRIAQGVEMKRPSVLAARAEKKDGKVTGVWIAGTCVMVSEGTIAAGY